MSKSLRNVVSPDEVIERFGSDSFRMFLMFMGPVDGGRAWETEQVSSTLRLLRRVWAFATGGYAEGLRDCVAVEAEPEEVRHAFIRLVARLTEDIESLRLNTAVAEVMKFMNVVEQQPVSRATLLDFIKVLNPLAPHLAEELWARAGHTSTIASETWPEADEAALLAAVETVQVVVQVGKRVRGRIVVTPSASDEEVAAAAAALLREKDVVSSEGPIVSRVVRNEKSGLPVLINLVQTAQ
jgi:leucyl-tRNA synthetase